MQQYLIACARWAALVCVLAAATFVPSVPVHAEAEALEPPDLSEPGKLRPERWWLEIYSHTMQERAFIQWMDDTTGGVAWRLTMPVPRVNSRWLWWSTWLWNPNQGSGNPAP